MTSDIVDDYWASKIKNECSTKDPDVNHAGADDILEDLLKQMGLYKTLKAYQDLERWY